MQSYYRQLQVGCVQLKCSVELHCIVISPIRVTTVFLFESLMILAS